MAKRFTDTNKYREAFFIELPAAYKLLWDYIQHDCDHAGIWIVNFRAARVYLGDELKFNQHEALRLFNADGQKVWEIDNGKKWFFFSFIELQYGVLNPENRAHNSVIKILEKYSLYKNKTLISPLEGAKDKDKDMVQDMDTDKDKVGVKIEDDFYDIALRYSNEQICWMLRHDIELHSKGAALKGCQMEYIAPLMEKFILVNSMSEEFTRDTFGMVRKHFMNWIVSQELTTLNLPTAPKEEREGDKW